MGFVHLHLHSHYSLLDGLPKIDEIVKKVKDEGMSAVALTDHGVMYGAIEFYQKAIKENIKPIIGTEAYVARNSHLDKRSKIDEKPYHLILLAKNHIGYKNLISLTSLAHLDGFYRKPRIDFELLTKYHEGIVAITACLQGELANHIINNNLAKAEEMIIKYKNLFGDDSFYLEVQAHPNLRFQNEVNERIFSFSNKLNVPVVATNDVHYLEPDDKDAQDILLCIQTKRKKDDKDRLTLTEYDLSFRSAERMISAFPDHPEVIINTEKVANQCNLKLDLGQTLLPQFPLPENKTADEYLKELCIGGLNKRYQIADHKKLINNKERKVIERMNFELSVIEKTGFASYFLIVQDFINWAKGKGIVVGPGRGSAAGSIIAYLTNITNMDPIKYELLFERFLNPERISMPDIDIDFADDRRDEVIHYVEEKYGHDHVAQIITFGTMAARAAIRDVGRALGLSYSYCDRVAKLIPMFSTLSEAIKNVAELKEIYDNDEEGRNLLDNAKKLEGVARHASTHACGVVITKDTLENYVPVQHASQNDETIITQYSLHAIEDLGLLKMDFLGLKNLTILQNAIEIIEKTNDTKILLDDLPLHDKKTFKLLQKAQTTGVFQLESSGMKRYLKQLKPTSLEDIIAMVSLYRPGPIELIPDFIAGKHGLKETHYLHPKLEPILKKTYGVAVYQEQIMQIVQSLAGFTLAEADVLRKAVGKKIAGLLNEQKKKFIDGCVENNIARSTAEKIFQFIEPFARYGFNRSHGACYALIAYQTAYFKANYSEAFMASLLTSDQENTDRISVEVDECKKMGIQVLPPDVNESYSTFTVVKTAKKPTIRFGLRAIKNVGSNIVRTIIQERKKNGPYKNLEDLLSRVNTKDLNKKSLESLVKCGALDSFGKRNQLLENINLLLSYSKSAAKESANGQTNFFRLNPVSNSPKLKLNDTAPATKEQRLAWEKELLGLYITEHPFSDYQKLLQNHITPINELYNVSSKQRVTIAGIITKIQNVLTRNHDQMLFVRLEDTTGSVEILVFPTLLKDNSDIWQTSRIISISGKISEKDDERKFLANKVTELNLESAINKVKSLKDQDQNNNFEKHTKPNNNFFIHVPSRAKRDVYVRLKELLAQHPGNTPVFLVVDNHDGQRVIKTTLQVQNNEETTKAIEALIGHDRIKIK
ncbi:DNA polymerase III subunit alpha [Patescibacteria group bacterium]|nr:DNA polymerase III subunit alpha [Patescibacteria group bacterium]MBU1891026.1 DNA polymerase III subunit alpha [Patescibacteria group bacterium]